MCEPNRSQSDQRPQGAGRCPHCDQSFTPRTSGGKPQKFCSDRCRRGFDQALRRLAYESWQAGDIEIGPDHRARWQEAHCCDSEDIVDQSKATEPLPEALSQEAKTSVPA